MANESQRLTEDERANLVAYLDGELSDDEARTLAAKLTQSVSARREVERLEATWALLDQLERPEAPPELKERTLTQIHLAETQVSPIGGHAADVLRRAARVAIAAVAFLGASGLGYVATRWLYPDPTRDLARHLTIAERLDQYEAVGSLEFLRLLDESTLLKDASPPE